MSSEMTDVEFLEKMAIAWGLGDGTDNPSAERYSRIAAALREHEELKANLEGLREEAERLVGNGEPTQIDSEWSLDSHGGTSVLRCETDGWERCAHAIYISDITTLPVDLLRVIEEMEGQKREL